MNSSKRKIDDVEDGPSSQTTTITQESQSQSSKTKKAKTDTTQNNPKYVNKVLPVNISFPPRIEGTLRIATWNICGLAASQKKVRQMICLRDSSNLSLPKGFKHYVDAEDPDILILTETKVRQ